MFGDRGKPGRPRADSVPGRKMELSPRQLDALQLCAAGLSRKDAASRLGVSLDTIKTLLYKAYIRLEAGSLMEAIVKARARYPDFGLAPEVARPRPVEPLALTPQVTQLANGMTLQIVVNLNLPPGLLAGIKGANAGDGGGGKP